MNSAHSSAKAAAATGASPAPTGRPARGRWLAGVVWATAYVFFAAFPLLILLAGDTPRGAGRGWDFAMGLGFGGLAVMGLQAILTARFRRATAPFGVDIIYYVHRLASWAGLALVGGHYVILRVGYAEAIGPLSPLTAPWPMTAGRLALALFLILIFTTIARKWLGIGYERWRWTHAVMAAVAVGLAMAHVWGVGHYVATPWQEALWGVYSITWLLVIAYVRLAHPLALRRRPYRVTAVRKERGRCWTLQIEPEGHAGIGFRPGQFAWLSLWADPLQAREHPFSFSGSAESAPTLQFTIKELGDFTRRMGEVKVGEVAFVDGPHGVFTPDFHPRAASFCLIGGGVGMAPLMSMLRTMADRRDPRPVQLVFGSRVWEEILFREELEVLTTRLTLQVVHVLQEPPSGWTGLTGMLTPDVLTKALPRDEATTVYFVCGPKPMSDSVQQTLRARGVPLHRIHCELFDMA